MRGLLAAALWALGAAGPARAGEPVRVLAAASLTDAFREIGARFERGRPGARVELSLAGTAVLRAQIGHGVGADVYAFADRADAEALVQEGLAGPYQVFARNAMCVVAPATRPRVRSLGDLARPGLAVVLAGPTVPAGRYALAVLERMDRSGRYGAGFAERVRANVVSQETSVRAVLAKVALGEADAGFVYRTDAAASPRVAVLEVPAEHNVAAEYPIGLLGQAPSAAARGFVGFVLGPQGREVLARHGFLLP